MDRIKRLSYEVLAQHKSKFNESFSDNKKLLDKVTIIRSKGLKNEIAGYITKLIKTEKRDAEIKQSQIEASKEEDVSVEETIEAEEPTTESEETVIEIGSETPEPESAQPEEKAE